MAVRDGDGPWERNTGRGVPETEPTPEASTSATAGCDRSTADARDATLDHVFRHWTLSPAMNRLRRLLRSHTREGKP
ncbi:MAG: hypothetical protein JJT90_09450 [Ectothiorhodospiraceae bacterium]|nr:hypothetical protein [Ectothiorhodospiraceae bacterium]